jgi:flagellar protein FlaG
VDLGEAVMVLNKAAHLFQKRLAFSVHEGSHRIMVKVIDAATDTVIREIPPEKVLDTYARIEEAVGLLVDEER